MGKKPSTRGARAATERRRSRSRVAATTADRGRWSSKRKVEVVLRLLKGETLDAVSRGLSVPTQRLSQWRTDFLGGGQSALKTREPDQREEEVRDLRVRIRRTLPFLVRAFLLAPPIQPRQRLPRGRANARRLRQTLQELLVGLSGIPTHDAPHRRVRFQRRRVDRNHLSAQKTRLRQALLDPGEHVTVGFQVDQPPGPRDRRMFRGPLLQPKPQEAPHPKRVRCTPRHPTLGVQALEVPHQQEPKVASRGQARTPQNRRIEPAASRFHESVEALGLQRSIQTRIERMPRAPRQIARRHPQRLLTFLMFAHRHARTLRHALVT